MNVEKEARATFVDALSPSRRPPFSWSSWLDRIIVACLLVMAFCAPHSIAGTQFGWACGLLAWLGRWMLRPRPRVFRTPVDYALLGFFILTFISALFSYAPDLSIGKLRAASLFTIVYLVAQNISSLRMVRALALVLVASCMINVAYTCGVNAIGRGVKIEKMSVESPLYRAGLREGDTLLQANGVTVRDPDAIEGIIRSHPTKDGRARLRVYRVEAFLDFELVPGHALSGQTSDSHHGVVSWTRGRDERASGFYGHYVTYAEMLQLIASLALGLLIACWQRDRTHARSWRVGLLAVALMGLSYALLLTVTRAAWLGFILSALAIVLTGAASRRAFLVVVLVAVPLVAGGWFVLQQKRQVGFLDRRDGSTAWRLMVYRESLDLLVREPRHLLVGVGMDSLKRYYREFRLFDNGRQNTGHLHSTPLQLAVERGLPTLFLWLALIFIYARMLWRLAREPNSGATDAQTWMEHGLTLGALGGLVGFLASGLVHYNLGDSEVAMIFYFIMGLMLVIERETKVAR